MKASLLLLLTILWLIAASASAQKANPLVMDKTGIHWVFPFPNAQQKAAAEKRLLMIKPVAFGTNAEGCW